jgi:NADH dehydrogenase FAD-containing subunit
MVEESAVQRNENLALTGNTGADAHGGEVVLGASGSKKGKVFEVDYDKLVVAVGCYSQTFGTKGVRENALFLKDVGDARKIRKRILDC